MEHPLLEVCADSLASCLAAQEGQADRIELCGNLVIGGTTPSEFLFRQVQKAVSLPVNVLIRPRFGDFLYTQDELEQMEAQVRRFRELGANGVVIGALTPEGDLDLPMLERLRAAAGDLEVTLHRAFDMARDLPAALETAVSLGFTTILTSGGESAASQGVHALAKLNRQSGGRIRLLAGAGVKSGNIASIHDATGITAFHSSCRTSSVNSGMVFRNPRVNMGLPGLSEYEIYRSDPLEVRKCADIVHSL